MQRTRGGVPRGSQHNTGNDCSRGQADLAETPLNARETRPSCSCQKWPLRLTQAHAAHPALLGLAQSPRRLGWSGEARTSWKLPCNKHLIRKPVVGSSLYPEMAKEGLCAWRREPGAEPCLSPVPLRALGRHLAQGSRSNAAAWLALGLAHS